MVHAGSGLDDSPAQTGGEIPGLPGAPAFVIRTGEASAIPVLIAIPHAGRLYPPALANRMRNPDFSALRLEDRHVDWIGEAVAGRTGAALLVAQAPRAMIDLNRHPADIDWGMVSSGGNKPDQRGSGTRARTGLGLIPRRLPGLGELWKQHHHEAEIAQRIATIHEPYHQALGHLLTRIRGRWGAALLIDLHSMPSLPRTAGMPPPHFVIGDRYGTTCDPALVAQAFAHFADAGRLAAHNRPYAGGYVLERHAAPAKTIHAIQIEIDRASYLDPQWRDIGQGFESVVDVMSGLVRRLADSVSEIGNSRLGACWAEAAE